MFKKTSGLLMGAALSMLGMSSAGASARLVATPGLRNGYQEPAPKRHRPVKRQDCVSAAHFRYIVGRRDGVNPAGMKLAKRAAKGLITKQGTR
jgi:hypothetical protein